MSCSGLRYYNHDVLEREPLHFRSLHYYDMEIIDGRVRLQYRAYEHPVINAILPFNGSKLFCESVDIEVCGEYKTNDRVVQRRCHTLSSLSMNDCHAGRR
jgi:hypothetical protein